MTSQSNEGRQSGVSRRRFLTSASAAAGAAATSTLWYPSLASGQQSDAAPRPTLICIFMRGGADGLSWAAPVTDPVYQNLRPTQKIAVPPTGSRQWLNVQQGFALPPSAIDPSATPVDMKVPFQQRDLTLVHGVGLAMNSRSHFEAMKHMEAGVEPPNTIPTTGWFGRYVSQFTSNAPVRGVSHGVLPVRSLAGAPKVPAIADVSTIAFPGNPVSAAQREMEIGTMHSGSAFTAVKNAAADSLAALNLLSPSVINYPTTPGAYPDNAFGRALQDTAAIMKSTNPVVDLEAVHIDIGGWDTHQAQQTNGPSLPGQSTFFDRANDVSKGLGAFYNDLGGSGGANRYVVMVMTEFGRRLFENGSVPPGTDHGTGGVMILMGDGVKQGNSTQRVHFPSWVPPSGPGTGLDSVRAPNGEDVKLETDIRHVIGEVLGKKMGVNTAGLQAVFPNFTVVNPGIVG